MSCTVVENQSHHILFPSRSVPYARNLRCNFEDSAAVSPRVKEIVLSVAMEWNTISLGVTELKLALKYMTFSWPFL
jgi:hypothetical protein